MLFECNSIYYSTRVSLLPYWDLGHNNTHFNEYYLQFLRNVTTTDLLILNSIGVYSIYYGLKIAVNELC